MNNEPNNTPGWNAHVSLYQPTKYYRTAKTFGWSDNRKGVLPQLRIIQDVQDDRECIFHCYVWTGDLGSCYQACLQRHWSGSMGVG
jgi:hypothetical protein